jgi:hypothetical protein
VCGARLWHHGGVRTAERKVRKYAAQIEQNGRDLRQEAAASAGQSRDDEELSHIAQGDEESAEDLTETHQAYEAKGRITDAGDHPERPVRTHCGLLISAFPAVRSGALAAERCSLLSTPALARSRWESRGKP